MDPAAGPTAALAIRDGTIAACPGTAHRLTCAVISSNASIAFESSGVAFESYCVEVSAIATLTIRGLDPETHARLRVEAARHGRSMEAEVRAILQERLSPRGTERGLGTRIHERFAGLEGEFQIPERPGEAPRGAVFGE